MKKKSRIIIVVSAVVILTAIVGGILFWYQGRGDIYSHDDFSFTIPRGWEEDDLVERGLNEYIIIRIREPEINATFHAQTLDTEGDVNFEELPGELNKTFAEQLGAFEELNVENDYEVGGQRALRYEYQHDVKVDDEVRRSQYIMIITKNENKLYYFVARANIENFDDQEKTLNRIIKTVDFASD